MTRDAAADLERDQLWDLTRARLRDASAGAVRRIAHQSPHFPGTRLAIAAALDELYGLARMLQELGRDEIGVFRGREEALAWLDHGVPADAALSPDPSG